MTPQADRWLLAALVFAGFVACKTQPAGRSLPAGEAGAASIAEPRPVRLYLVSDLAGALAPCGCVADQLGGLDHLGQWMVAERARASATLLVAAGPLFFASDQPGGDRAGQDHQKATTLANVLGTLHLAAFAPGVNDWDEGASGLVHLAERSGAAILAGSVASAAPPLASAVVKDVGGLRIGLVGFGQGPAAASDGGSDGAEAAVASGVESAKKQGANVIVALAAVGREEARRIAQAIPELTAILVGSPRARGDANATTPQGERVGPVLLAQGGNHLQSVGVLDLYVRGPVEPGHVIHFADATGMERAEEREDLARRIDGLHEAISVAQRRKTLSRPELDARNRDLDTLERERQKLDVKPAPDSGSFFRYALRDVRESMGSDPSIQTEINACEAEISGQNRRALARKGPSHPSAGRAGYVGASVCASCHKAAATFWKKTLHAHAYESLRVEGREFDLECVGCHVTGYDAPGGSTLTHVGELGGVQCEACHGPGSKHAVEPLDDTTLTLRPAAAQCLDCHRPPQVERNFDVDGGMTRIRGPGHGMPVN